MSPDESLHVISDRCVQRACILQSTGPVLSEEQLSSKCGRFYCSWLQPHQQPMSNNSHQRMMQQPLILWTQQRMIRRIRQPPIIGTQQPPTLGIQQRQPPILGIQQQQQQPHILGKIRQPPIIGTQQPPIHGIRQPPILGIQQPPLVQPVLWVGLTMATLALASLHPRWPDSVGLKFLNIVKNRHIRIYIALRGRCKIKKIKNARKSTRRCASKTCKTCKS